MDGPFAFLKTVFLESWGFGVDHLFLHFLFLPAVSRLDCHVILRNKWPYVFQWAVLRGQLLDSNLHGILDSDRFPSCHILGTASEHGPQACFECHWVL